MRILICVIVMLIMSTSSIDLWAEDSSQISITLKIRDPDQSINKRYRFDVYEGQLGAFVETGKEREAIVEPRQLLENELAEIESAIKFEAENFIYVPGDHEEWVTLEISHRGRHGFLQIERPANLGDFGSFNPSMGRLLEKYLKVAGDDYD